MNEPKLTSLSNFVFQFQLSQVVQDVAEAIASQHKLRSSKNFINANAVTPTKTSFTGTTKPSTSTTGQKLDNSKDLSSSTSASPSPSSLPRNCLVKGMSVATNKLRASPDTPSQVTPPRSGPRSSPKGTSQESATSSPKSPSRSRRNSSSSTTSTSAKPTLRSTSPRGTPISSPKGSPRGTPRGSPRHTPVFASKPQPKPTMKVAPRNSAKVSPVVVLNDHLSDGDGPPTPPTTRSHVKAEPEEAITAFI